MWFMVSSRNVFSKTASSGCVIIFFQNNAGAKNIVFRGYILRLNNFIWTIRKQVKFCFYLPIYILMSKSHTKCSHNTQYHFCILLKETFFSPHNFWTKIALFFGTYCNNQVKIPTDKL